MNSRLILLTAVALTCVGAAAASSAAAQERQPEPAWSLFLERPGSRHEVDTLVFVQTEAKRYRFVQRVSLDQPFTNPAGERFDRIESVSEYDCDRARYRDVSVMLILGDSLLRGMSLPDEWAAPETTFREVFDHICAFLIALGARRPLDPATYDMRIVERFPELVNRTEIARLISRRYPRAQRDAGTDGRVELGFKVLADGSVDSTSIFVRSASSPAFGEAALAIVARMKFSPAMIRGRGVAAWVRLPISFNLQSNRVVAPTVAPPGWCASSGSMFCGQ